ncbi:histidine kinase [Kineococcus aurantiacus]|uniref:histidine kinase n=1 Tax=Kineococcus aurantiacus TaxID=37633 RepID=A0A7Y9J162_9ACTN|nr:signal transduction histidine kinase [Kineococcus aurantiacus]
MFSGAQERAAAVTGYVALAAVGVLAAVGAWDGPPGTRGWWWVAYGVFALSFVVDDVAGSGWLVPRPRWLPPAAPLAVGVVAALVAWWIAPQANWTAILFVVAVVPAALTLSPAVTAVLIAVQSAAVVAGAARAGLGTGQVVALGTLYGALQVFAAVLVVAGRRQAEQRTALAAAHAQLRAASALLAASSRDAERLRISRELHDVVGHGLTALALELEVASHRADGPVAEHVDRARGIAKDLLGDVRTVVGDLRGEVQGLESALREVVGRAPGLPVVLTVREEVPVGPERALVVVRAAQELLTNTLRHAGAHRFTLDVVATAAGVRLEAADDGRGSGHLRPGNGLAGLVERVEGAGGTVRFRTAPGRGFRTELEVPA